MQAVEKTLGTLQDAFWHWDKDGTLEIDKQECLGQLRDCRNAGLSVYPHLFGSVFVTVSVQLWYQ